MGGPDAHRPRPPAQQRGRSAPHPGQMVSTQMPPGRRPQWREKTIPSPEADAGHELPPVADFTGRPGGGAVRRFRIGSPTGQGGGAVEDAVIEEIDLFSEMELTEEEKKHFDDYQRLKATIGSVDSRLDQVLMMLMDNMPGKTAFSGRHGSFGGMEDLEALLADDGAENKLERLHHMVQEATKDGAEARKRIIWLEQKLSETQEELYGCETALASSRRTESSARAELATAKAELQKLQAESEARLRKAENLEKEASHFQKLAVDNIRERRTRGKADEPQIVEVRNDDGTVSIKQVGGAVRRGSAEAFMLMDRLNRQAKERGQATAEGPTGKVTLVFTDIQGSTNLWEFLQDRMHGQLEKHNNLIRQEIRRWKGYEVKTQGDSFMVAFSDPVNAVGFCMGVQLTLLKGGWDKILDGCRDAVKRVVTLDDGQPFAIWDGLRVRMGAHMGEPICQIDVTSGRMDYFGPVVNQSARVQGIAYGGMVTLTPEIVDHLKKDEHRLPSHLKPELFSLGSFTLKGIEKPVPLVHALPPCLVKRVEDFPPLRSQEIKDEKEIIAAAGAPTGRVTFCFLRMENAHQLKDHTVKHLWPDSLKLFRNEVRVSAEIVGGYVSRCDEDRTTVVFQHAAVAFRWAMELQENLMRLAWDPQILSTSVAGVEVWRGKEIMRGARVQIGMHTADECEPNVDPLTSQVLYVGEGVQVAGALSLDARGGETLVSENIFEEVNQAVRDKFLLAREQFYLDGWNRPLDCYLAYPKGLTGRAAWAKGVPLEDFEGLGGEEDEEMKLAQTQAPYGNVALVFTDIQNSTKLWDTSEEMMAKVVKMHHVSMRAGITRFQGYEVKTEGDAFMVAFGDTMDAVRWCLYMQETLLAIAYPEDFLKLPDAHLEMWKGEVLWKGVRVRMGVHSGQPQCEVDPVTKRMDYYGPMVNKAARVSSLAQGGQIVVSEPTYDIMKPLIKELGNPVVTDGGERALKGISKNTRVYFMLPHRLRKRKFKEPEKKPVEGPPQKDGGLERMHANMEEEEQVRLTAAQAIAPTGRVSLCFTDIQSSTVLWENNPRMPQAVQAHHRVMRKGIAKWEGYEVKTEGDAFMVAFHSSLNATAWCLDMQEQLMQVNWDQELLKLADAQIEYDNEGTMIWCGPRVRMGVHVASAPDLMSEPDPVSGRMDYYGRGVNKAARVGGKGKGGESVISGDVYDEIKQASAEEREKLGNPDIQFAGDQTLKGIAGTTAIFSCVPSKTVARRETWRKMDEKAAAAQEHPDINPKWAHLEQEYARREAEQRSAPTGVVTIVFTDVQSSTELWDQYEDQMRASVVLHHALMRKWITRLRGYEVKTEGDAFMVAFHTPCDALAWCIGTQIELMKIEWPSEIHGHKWASRVEDSEGNLVWNGPRVRMGIHTGKVDSETDTTMGRIDYYGPEVNKAARIGGIGTGGEVVISEQGLEAARKQSEDLGAVGRPIIQHLGQRKLKGITKECHVYRVLPTSLSGRNYEPKDAAAPPEENKIGEVLTGARQSHAEEGVRQRTRRSSQPINDDAIEGPQGR
eukprot:Hpha_TRINITY_DN19295_c0_g1::TRINITY_DN19295_c0_g1_i1::g.194366::m.194366